MIIFPFILVLIRRFRLGLVGFWVWVHPTFLFIMLKIFFFGETRLHMLKLFLKKKKSFCQAAFTRCETGDTLKLLTSISSEFLLCNKNFFLSKLRIFSFIYKKSFKLFRHICIKL